MTLDGTSLSTINFAALAPNTLLSKTISVTDALLGGQSGLDLAFTYNGPTGSTMILDNVMIPGGDLLNGDFQTQTLAAWGTTGSGSVEAVAVSGGSPPSLVPLPATA